MLKSIIGLGSFCGPGAVFTKGLSQVLGLSWLYFYTKLKPKTWLRPFVNTAPGFNSISQDIRMSMSDHAKASEILPKGVSVNIEEV